MIQWSFVVPTSSYLPPPTSLLPPIHGGICWSAGQQRSSTSITIDKTMWSTLLNPSANVIVVDSQGPFLTDVFSGQRVRWENWYPWIPSFNISLEFHSSVLYGDFSNRQEWRQTMLLHLFPLRQEKSLHQPFVILQRRRTSRCWTCTSGPTAAGLDFLHPCCSVNSRHVCHHILPCCKRLLILNNV